MIRPPSGFRAAPTALYLISMIISSFGFLNINSFKAEYQYNYCTNIPAADCVNYAILYPPAQSKRRGAPHRSPRAYIPPSRCEDSSATLLSACRFFAWYFCRLPLHIRWKFHAIALFRLTLSVPKSAHHQSGKPCKRAHSVGQRRRTI